MADVGITNKALTDENAVVLVSIKVADDKKDNTKFHDGHTTQPQNSIGSKALDCVFEDVEKGGKISENENVEGALEHNNQPKAMRYTVEECPPWHTCILLGIQHYLTAVGGIIAIPMILASYLCMEQDIVGVSELIGTILFVSGLATVLQSTFGVRLPIVQGSTATFLIPTIAILTTARWKCPYTERREMIEAGLNVTMDDLPEIGSPAHKEIWMTSIREIQGAIMVASLFQVAIGFSGIMNFAIRYIGPLSITPIISLTGYSLTPIGYDLASGQWWIALMTMAIILLFSQYLRTDQLPRRSCKTFKMCKTNLFSFLNNFPVLLAIIFACVLCTILTLTDVFPNDSQKWGYLARTDRNLYVMKEAKWFRFPYPGQWGIPTISVASVFGMLAGVLAAMLESVGDYFACARIAGAPPPPSHALNRGIFIEGVACVLTGAWGSGNGTTSFSQNIGVIGITKVGSRRVVQIGGCLMLILGCFGKFAAVFTLIPAPVFGGLFLVTFGMIIAVGLSNLQYVDLNSSRNLCILGASMFIGLCVPFWIKKNPEAVDTGNDVVDQIITVLLRTSMFVGGFVGFVLDNTIPGTDGERGLTSWRVSVEGDNLSRKPQEMRVYYPPFYENVCKSFSFIKYFPIFPNPDVNEK